MSLFSERRPDMHTARHAWEASWDSDLEKNFKPGTGLFTRVASLAAVTGDADARGFASDVVLLQAEQEVRLICAMQTDLARVASRRCAEEDFENKWRSLDKETRKQVVLEGIYRTMCIPDMEERRKWCPDSSLKHLTSRNGETYLDMLRGLLPVDLGKEITEPIQISHPVIDKLFKLNPNETKKPAYRTMVRMYVLARTYCLSTIVWNIFLAFHGEREQQLAIKPPKADRAAARTLGATITGTGSARRTLDTDGIARQHNIARKELKYACWYCSRSEAVDENVKLSACSKCRAIDRKVYYCSRDCQVKDWKNGKPRPHRAICGKPLETPDEAPAAGLSALSLNDEDEDEDDGIIPPDPSFRRSPALLHQISLLREERSLHYVLVFPHPKPDMGIIFNTVEGDLMFRMAKNRAFRNGDPRSVRYMAIALGKMADANGIPRSHVKKQLEAEYGITLADPEEG